MKIIDILNEDASYDRFGPDSKFNHRPSHDLLPGEHTPFDFTGFKKYKRSGDNISGDELREA
jgi:hypothetical protein